MHKGKMNPQALIGLDVSHYQGDINWVQVKADGYKFAWAKCSEYSKDDKFDKNKAGAKAAGILIGAYDFFHPGKDPEAQAAQFLALAKPGPGDLLPFLDWEVTDGTLPAQDLSRGQAWLNVVEKAIGRKPAVYGGVYFFEALKLPPEFHTYPLMLAQYRNFDPLIPEPWADWTFWQHDSKGHVLGISGNTDMDWFNGTEEDLKKFIL